MQIPFPSIQTVQAASLQPNYGFGNVGSLGELLGKLTAPVFEFAGVALVLYFLIGAFKLLISAGDKNAVASARAMITHAVIGFLLLIIVFLLAKYIPEAFGININILT